MSTNCKDGCAGMLRAVTALLAVWALGLSSPARAEEDVEVVRPIMAGDQLRIAVAEAPEMNRVYAVAGDGTIDMTLIGRVNVDGLQSGAAAEKIEELLEIRYFKKASVSVEVAEFMEGSILVLGALKNPGTIPFRGDQMLSLLEAISMSGGLRADAAGDDVRILRLRPRRGLEREVVKVDIKGMMENLDFSNDQFLRPRDIIFVPALGAGERKGEFLALGEVGSPGFHPHTDGLDMIRAVARVGGLSREGRMDAARLLRPDGKGQYRVIPVDLARLFSAADMQMNVPVLAGDILFVPSAQQSVGGRIYLLGEVAQPGMMGLPTGSDATLARVILGRGGFSKFANDSRVRILRKAPDGKRQTLEVDVGRILKTGAFDEDVPLNDEDVVIVPERMLF